MKTIQVKICGIRRLESATAAIEAGADFIGFNFIPSSKRYIHPEVAKEIALHIKSTVKLVGVFKDAKITHVNKISEIIGLDFVQLHGKETPQFVKHIHTPVIKTFACGAIERITDYTIAYVLLDRNIQGQGKRVPLKTAKAVSSQYSLLLAGGLTVQNVAQIVQKVQPCGVDVAGGIETRGKEDAMKIREFIKAVKGVHL